MMDMPMMYCQCDMVKGQRLPLHFRSFAMYTQESTGLWALCNLLDLSRDWTTICDFDNKALESSPLLRAPVF